MEKNVFGALLTDLSKAFDCLDHELLTDKSNAYSFNLPVLPLINDYLLNSKQRIKTENTYSTWMGCKLYLESHKVQY